MASGNQGFSPPFLFLELYLVDSCSVLGSSGFSLGYIWLDRGGIRIRRHVCVVGRDPRCNFGNLRSRKRSLGWNTCSRCLILLKISLCRSKLHVETDSFVESACFVQLLWSTVSSRTRSRLLRGLFDIRGRTNIRILIKCAWEATQCQNLPLVCHHHYN